MKRVVLITALTSAAAFLAALSLAQMRAEDNLAEVLKVGFVYISDESTAYTHNFIHAQEAAERQFGDRIAVSAKYNVSETQEKEAFLQLIDEGCGLIFSTSYGFGKAVKQLAADYPEVEFCQTTCGDANQEPVLSNYHNFMGRIYEGRYISGVAAGMKLTELIEENVIAPEQARIGYVAAFPYSEVISGYTAFFLGARSVCPSATMDVSYMNTWSSLNLEKELAARLIENGCVIISQHSDTAGAAYACEETHKSTVVYHVGYNRSMTDVAPTTHIISSRINWTPYVTSAIEAVLANKAIETQIKGRVVGNDSMAGFDEGWVEMLQINTLAAASGTENAVEELIRQFETGTIEVFRGDYTGTNPYDETDRIDLSAGYKENEFSSAPAFSYILDDVITIVE